MGASASIVGEGGAAATAAAVSAAAAADPLLIFTDIRFSTSAQMKQHTSLMVHALDMHQRHLVRPSPSSATDGGNDSAAARRYDKVFALEQTGDLKTTLIEVAVPSALWAEAALRQQQQQQQQPQKAPGDGQPQPGPGPGATAAHTAAVAHAEEAERGAEDPDASVTVGGLPGGIRCQSWVGGDAPLDALPAFALESLRRRGVTPAPKLAGFCYGSSFADCTLFVCHKINWKAGSEDAVHKYAGLVQEQADGAAAQRSSMFALFRLPSSLHSKGTITTALLELTSVKLFSAVRSSGAFHRAQEPVDQLLQLHCNQAGSEVWLHFAPRLPQANPTPDQLAAHRRGAERQLRFVKEELKRLYQLPSGSVYHSTPLTALGLFEDAPVISSFLRSQKQKQHAQGETTSRRRGGGVDGEDDSQSLSSGGDGGGGESMIGATDDSDDDDGSEGADLFATDDSIGTHGRGRNKRVRTMLGDSEDTDNSPFGLTQQLVGNDSDSESYDGGVTRDDDDDDGSDDDDDDDNDGRNLGNDVTLSGSMFMDTMPAPRTAVGPAEHKEETAATLATSAAGARESKSSEVAPRSGGGAGTSNGPQEGGEGKLDDGGPFHASRQLGRDESKNTTGHDDGSSSSNKNKNKNKKAAASAAPASASAAQLEQDPVLQQLRSTLQAKVSNDLFDMLTSQASSDSLLTQPDMQRGQQRGLPGSAGAGREGRPAPGHSQTVGGAEIEKDMFLQTMSAEDLGLGATELQHIADSLESAERNGKIPMSSIEQLLRNPGPAAGVGGRGGGGGDGGRGGSGIGLIDALHRKFVSGVFRRYGNMKKAFTLLDRDRSNYIEKAEMQEGLQRLGLAASISPAKLNLFIAKFDTNSDGRFDFSEFVRLMQTGFVED